MIDVKKGACKMKTLVAYYSLDGSTATVAKAIAAALPADLLFLQPVKDLQAKGFAKYVLGGAQVVMGIRPKLLPFAQDPAGYDRILLGSPIWAGSFTPPVKTFLADTRLQGKPIAYFYCNEGGAEKATERARRAIGRNSQFIGSLGLVSVYKHPDESCAEAVAWAKSLDQE
jgi:menaquinone-dependent protoporphyrinogen IX oxidase